jgi:SAM-dependent methyltransferase
MFYKNQPAPHKLLKQLTSFYFKQALFISRRPYGKAATAFAFAAAGLLLAGSWADAPSLWVGAAIVTTVGLGLFAVSITGLYRFYGKPALAYYRRIVDETGLGEGCDAIAELHIGTYRHARALGELLGRATIHTVDCWSDEAGHAEPSLEEIRALDPPPQEEPRLRMLRAKDGKVPIADASCDAVVLGVGFHEFEPAARETLLREAVRVLKPRGKVVLFEHVRNLRNQLVFGRAVGHWPTRDEWTSTLGRHLDGVRHVAIGPAVDLFEGQRR